jgi:hypothetical protein
MKRYLVNEPGIASFFASNAGGYGSLPIVEVILITVDTKSMELLYNNLDIEKGW